MLVEQKLESSEGFGKGRKVHMTFGQLVQQLHKGNDSLYLTTQEVSHMHMLLHHPSTVYQQMLCICDLRSAQAPQCFAVP